MTFMLLAMAAMFWMSQADPGDFNSSLDPEDRVVAYNCASHHRDGVKVLGSHAYGSSSDLSYETDDVVIHCRQPILLSPKSQALVEDILPDLSHEVERALIYLRSQPLYAKDRFVVHSYHHSYQLSHKITTALKSGLGSDFMTIDQELHPMLLSESFYSTDQLRGLCLSGGFETSAGITRIFAMNTKVPTRRLYMALCRGAQWLPI